MINRTDINFLTNHHQNSMPKNPFPISTSLEKKITNKLSSLSIEEKVGQVFMPGLLGNYISNDSDEFNRLKKLVTKYKVGGFVMFSGHVHDYVVNINKLQAMSEIPLLTSADFERGVAMRIPEATPFPHAMGLAAANDLSLVQKAAEIISIETRALGVHQNYAPVADLCTNFMNPIVNTRAFSDDPMITAKFGAAFIKGMRKQRIISTAKHFPGHGDTEIDSHRDLPTISASKETMYARELIPFIKLIETGVQSIMIGHLSVPAFEENKSLPAVLSKKIITGLLKEELKFKGLIVTDALNMQAVCNYFSVAESAVLAFNAGNDLLLFTADDEIAIKSVIEAVKRGIISGERLNESVVKILRAKAWAGLFESKNQTDISQTSKMIASKKHFNISYSIANKSITLVKDENKIFPIDVTKNISVVTLVDSNVTETESYFQKYLDQKIFLKRKTILSAASSKEEIEASLISVADDEIILIPAFVRIRAYQGFSALPEKLNLFIQKIIEREINYALFSFGNPYLLSLFPKIKTYVAAFGDSYIVQKSCVDILTTKKEFIGKLPVEIPNTTFKRELY